MHALLTKSSFVVVVATVVLVATAGPAFPATPIAPTLIGYDISFPQCRESLPPSPGFGVVGVNAGHPFSVNPCLARELAWAQGAVNPNPGFYANADNPGPTFATNWPTNQQTPKLCSGADSVACSYDYGWNAARLAFANVVNAEQSNGSSSPTAAAVAAPWWLDVETGNKWQTIELGRSAATGTYDEATIEGMIASFTNIGVTSLGIYSTSQQWNVITVSTPSSLLPVPVWIPGFGSVPAAQVGCGSTSFTGGRVAMIQFGLNGFDGDFVCGILSAPVSTAVSVAGSSAFTSQLVTTNNNGAVSYVQTSGTPQLAVSASGVVTTSGALPVGTYVATGTSVDAKGNAGTFSMTLAVGKLLQGVPTTGAVKTSASANFTSQLNVTGNSGAVAFVQTSGSPQLIVSTSGLVTTSGVLPSGTYVARGTTSDGSGDVGRFTFSLTVGTLVQRAPTSASVTTTGSSTYSVQLSVGANTGTVSYVQNRGRPNLVVNSSGLVTTSGTLASGAYLAAGTLSDPSGDVGTFSFKLNVSTAQVVPTATSIVGHVIAGDTVTLAIHGTGFYGRPSITSHAGTTVLVTRDTGLLLIVRVTSRARSRNGVFTFTITLSDGLACTVRYNQR
ncbi:MAG: autotransporter outer membrane beta-barrel domain-containing protein [Acidimicrobiales bacterium]